MKNDYLIKKKPLAALLIFCLPMIIGNLFQQLYNTVDSAVVGRFVSEQALAAVGASYALTNVFICIAIGGGVGASVIVSLYFGQGDMHRMKAATSTALITFLSLSLVLMSSGLLLGQKIMLLLNTPADILNMATEYLRIYFAGLPFLFMYNVLSCMFNALGKSRIPLFFLIFSSVLNVILDIYMVVHLDMGISGVAWATVIAQAVSVTLSYTVYRRLMNNLLNEQCRCFDLCELKNMVHIAIPSIIQQSTISIGMMLVQSVVNSFGSEVLAGFSAAMRVEQICVVPMSALGNAMSSYTAQNLGAQHPDRVRAGHRSAAAIVSVFSIFICITLIGFNRPIIHFFLGDAGTTAAISTGCGYLHFVGWFFVLLGLKMTVDGLLRGAGDLKMFLIANLANLSLRYLLSVSLAPKIGFTIIWIAVPIGWLVNWLISFVQYRTGKWQHALNKPMRT